MGLIGVLSAIGMAAMAGPASAGIWTEIPSGTAAEITAIEYRGGDQFWFTTGSGKIFKRIGGTFQERYTSPSGAVYRDIEFSADGAIGLAVGTNGDVARSVDGGMTWVPVAIPAAVGNPTAENDCNDPLTVGDLDSVRIDGQGRAWITGGGSQIWRSSGFGAVLGTLWADANDGPADSCLLDRDADDVFFVPGTSTGYFIGKVFGAVRLTTSLLATTATPKAGSAGNGFQNTRRVTGDPASPNRMWAVIPGSGGTSYVKRTIDGWNAEVDWALGNDDRRTFTNAYDVDYAGGTVLTAGEAGMVLHSTDGATFFYDDADGALATQDWRAVSLADGANGAIGGTNGKLAVTTAASVLPDTVKPTGTISGPATVQAGRPATFTLNAADEGGSGLNAASFAWTSPGLPAASGPSVALTFPNTGFATITVTFADNAGNVATATKSVTIGRAGAATLPVSFTGPGSSLGAKVVGNRVRIRARGTITVPAGSTLRAACKGKVTLTVKKKRKTLATRTAKLKRKSGRCRFGKTIFIKRSKVGRSTTRLRLKISFKGNAALAGGQATKTLVVKK